MDITELLAFAVKNTEMAAVRFPFGLESEVPLIVVMRGGSSFIW